jgi:hypothetical protein
MAAGIALKVANLGSLVRSAQAPRFSEGSMSHKAEIRTLVGSTVKGWVGVAARRCSWRDDKV